MLSVLDSQVAWHAIILYWMTTALALMALNGTERTVILR